MCYRGCSSSIHVYYMQHILIKYIRIDIRINTYVLYILLYTYIGVIMYECLQRHKKKLRGLPTNITIDFYKKARGTIKGISTVDLEVRRVIILTFSCRII